MSRARRKPTEPRIETVYKPIVGSGSTLIAAERTSRIGCGMELSPAYCDVIVARWEKLTGKKAILEQKL
jgi:DNA modification methylase